MPNVKSPLRLSEELDEKTQEATDLNLPATTFAPVVHKSKIMGIIERRDSGLDKVADLDAALSADVFNAARESSAGKLDTIAKTQARIADQLKDNEQECEKASTALYFAATAFKSQCAELKQLGRFGDDVREAKEAIDGIVDACERLRMLLPEEMVGAVSPRGNGINR